MTITQLIRQEKCILGKVERINVEDGTFALTPEEDVRLSGMANGDVMSDGSDEEGKEHDEEGQDVNENHPMRLQDIYAPLVVGPPDSNF